MGSRKTNHVGEQGFTLVELMVVVGLVGIASVLGSQMIDFLNQGVGSAQSRADFTQLQSMGNGLLYGNATKFCQLAGILNESDPTKNLLLPNAAQVAQYLDPALAVKDKPAAARDFFSKIHFPFAYAAPAGASVVFGVDPPAVILALSAGRTLASASAPTVTQEFTIPFTLSVQPKMGGTVTRQFPLLLDVDKDRKIAQCRSIASSLASDSPAEPPAASGWVKIPTGGVIESGGGFGGASTRWISWSSYGLMPSEICKKAGFTGPSGACRYKSTTGSNAGVIFEETIIANRNPDGKVALCCNTQAGGMACDIAADAEVFCIH